MISKIWSRSPFATLEISKIKGWAAGRQRARGTAQNSHSSVHRRRSVDKGVWPVQRKLTASWYWCIHIWIQRKAPTGNKRKLPIIIILFPSFLTLQNIQPASYTSNMLVASLKFSIISNYPCLAPLLQHPIPHTRLFTSKHAQGTDLSSLGVSKYGTNLHVAKVGDWHDSHFWNIIATDKYKHVLLFTGVS